MEKGLKTLQSAGRAARRSKASASPPASPHSSHFDSSSLGPDPSAGHDAFAPIFAPASSQHSPTYRAQALAHHARSLSHHNPYQQHRALHPHSGNPSLPAHVHAHHHAGAGAAYPYPSSPPPTYGSPTAALGCGPGATAFLQLQQGHGLPGTAAQQGGLSLPSFSRGFDIPGIASILAPPISASH
jgi:hypothetical protein